MEKINIDRRDVWQHSISEEDKKAGKKPLEQLISSMSNGMLFVVFRECIKRLKQLRDKQILFTAKLERVMQIMANRGIIIPRAEWSFYAEKDYALKLKTIPSEDLIVEMRTRLINGEITMQEAQEHVMQYAHEIRREILTKNYKNTNK